MTKITSGTTTVRISAPDDFPAWRANKSVGTRYTLANTAEMSGYVKKLPDATIDDQVNAWSSFAWDGLGKWYSAANAGHGYPTNDAHPDGGAAWQNHVLGIDFFVDAPLWYEIDPGSDYESTPGAHDIANCLIRYADNRPCSRHIYNCAQYASAAHAPDSKARILLIGCMSAWANDADAAWPQWTGTKYTGGPEVEGFRIVDAAWDDRSRWASMEHGDTVALQAHACVTDHRTGYIYQSVGKFAEFFDPYSNAWTLMHSQGSGLDNWNFGASLIDVTRERFVGILPALSSDDSTLRLECVDLAPPYALDTITLTGLPNGFANFAYPMTLGGNGVYQAGVVHNLDNDRYWLFRRDNEAYDIPVVEIDPVTGDTTELSIMVSHLETGGGNGVFGRVAYSQPLGCVIYFPDYYGDIVFYPTR